MRDYLVIDAKFDGTANNTDINPSEEKGKHWYTFNLPSQNPSTFADASMALKKITKSAKNNVFIAFYHLFFGAILNEKIKQKNPYLPLKKPDYLHRPVIRI